MIQQSMNVLKIEIVGAIEENSISNAADSAGSFAITEDFDSDDDNNISTSDLNARDQAEIFWSDDSQYHPWQTTEIGDK